MARNHNLLSLGYPVPNGQILDINGTTPDRSAAGFSSQTRRVLLTSSTTCFVRLGDSTVVATSSDIYVRAGQPYVFDVRPGQYVSVVRSTAGLGNLFVDPLTS